MPYVIVEYDFDPPITEERLEQMAGALAACVSARQLRRLRTIISADRKRGFCELEAPDAETVREAYRSARVPFKSVWSAELLDFRAPGES
jgi:hypothetical protein